MASCASATLTLAVVLIILIFLYNNVYGDGDEQQLQLQRQQQQQSCSTKCGVHNISYPFRLEDSPKMCGDERYILSCEDNDQLILYYESKLPKKVRSIWGSKKTNKNVRRKKALKYYVQSINYNNFTIRLLDFNLVSSSRNNSIPPYKYSLGLYKFSSFSALPYLFYQYKNDSFKNILMRSMLYVSCPNRVDSYQYRYGANCINSTLYSLFGNSFYVDSDNKSLSELRLGDGCHIEFMYLTSWPLEVGHGGRGSNNNMSCKDIRNMMFYGFELSWINGLCKYGWYVKFHDNNQSKCVPSGNYVPFSFKSTSIGLGAMGFLFSIIKFILGVPCIIIILIYKCRRKHLSMYYGIEDFLRSSDNRIMPLRYSYKEIKKITQQFKTKLGNGGYGSVFKGQLRSGRLVAVKLLDKGKSNGQDFINEVATIGRIHHVNVVQLIGFCVEGSERALIYEFMSNGSLEKYIYSNIEVRYSLSCEKLHTISLGVARGIEYLHNGCSMKILHFDIKPHNILLDENFNPKVSDFGLARLCPTDNSIVSLTAVRGTIGYMAPELFYRNVGTISYKADIYSFGMLLMEMASRRKNLKALAEQSSQIYFPFWVYDQLQDGREITIENDTNQETKLAKKMMIVALWCIQTKPDDRPPMDKVLEMLEEKNGDLEMPNKPYLYAQDQTAEDAIDDDSTSSSWSSNVH
ncbi:rust resistance kinase Lr10-like [Trifolium pratense]|uniref:rust resistance kinase Lr10-like n=1 Tax=Trifolium pratense TaxID=57577 RepID=UPI001E69525E|nr:rust resistance kinase Lr10-like [Trifolium pratense]